MSESWETIVYLIALTIAFIAALAALVFILKPLFKRRPQRISMPFKAMPPQEMRRTEGGKEPLRETPSQLSLQIHDLRLELLRTFETMRLDVRSERAVLDDRFANYEHITHSVLAELGGKVDALATTVAQYSKDVGKIEGRLMDVVQVFGVLISEVRGLASKIQKIADEDNSPKRGPHRT